MSLKNSAKKMVQDAAEQKAKQHESLAIEGEGDGQVLTMRSKTVRTLEAALKVGKVDEALWEVERWKLNKWDVAGIVHVNDRKRLAATELWQVSVWLKRKAPKHVQDGISQLCESLSAYKPAKFVKRRRTKGRLLEVSPFDAHFGKLCWGEETGVDYDTRIAERVYQNAFEDLLQSASSEPIEEIWIPVGNDFFHVNNWLQTTAKGTAQDHDGRLPKVFQAGSMAMIRGIDLCRQMAPVKLFWVPGNHDPETSYYLLCVLAAYYRTCKNVTVDTSPMPRKVKTFGKCFLLFTHGDEEPARDLPNIAATSAPQEWAATYFREAHVGHYHKKKEMRTVDVDEFQGFRWRILPSLSGCDRWHFSRGYVGSRRAAEAYMWSAEDGYVGHLSANVRET